MTQSEVTHSILLADYLVRYQKLFRRCNGFLAKLQKILLNLYFHV